MMCYAKLRRFLGALLGVACLSVPTAAQQLAVPDGGPCTTCIHLRETTILGTEDGPGYLEETQYVAIDRSGQYLVVQPQSIKVYSAGGEFLRTIGRAGQGPSEFGDLRIIEVDENEHVHTFDNGNLKRVVFDTTLAVQKEQRTPGPIQAARLLPGARRYVANALVHTPEHVAFPLHIFDAATGSILVSFGERRPVTELNPFYTLKELAVDVEGRIFAAGTFDYQVDVWSATGESLFSFQRSGLWERTSFIRGSPDPYPMLTDIHVDDAGLLWVAAWVPRDDWRDNVVAAGPTTPGWQVQSDVYESIVEVIDVSNRMVVAHAELGDFLISEFIDDGLVQSLGYLESGAPIIRVGEIRFQPR